LSLATRLIYAKSGMPRIALSDFTGSIATTTIENVFLFGESWNNTTDNITSLVAVATKNGGIGAGSYLTLYKKVNKI